MRATRVPNALQRMWPLLVLAVMVGAPWLLVKAYRENKANDKGVF